MEQRKQMGLEMNAFVFSKASVQGLQVFAYFSFLLLGFIFLIWGQGFTHAAPKGVWVWVFICSLFGLYYAQKVIPRWICWLFAATLGIRFIVDLLAPPQMASFGVKAVQRFAIYEFAFLPFALMTWALAGRSLLPEVHFVVRRCIILFSLFFLVCSAFLHYYVAQGIHYTLLGILALIALQEEKNAPRWLEFLLVILMGMSLGSSRSMWVTTFVAVLFYTWFAYDGNFQGKFRRRKKIITQLSLSLSFIIGSFVTKYILDNMSGMSRLWMTASLFFYQISLLISLNTQDLITGMPAGVFGLSSLRVEKGEVLSGIYSFLPQQEDGAASSNFYWRVFVWKDAIRTWLMEPFLGIGFKSIFVSPLANAAFSKSVGLLYMDLDLHNSWLQVLLRGGLFVALPFYAFWVAVFKKLGVYYRSVLVLFFVYALPIVCFETPQIALPFYIALGLIPLMARPKSPSQELLYTTVSTKSFG